MNCYRKYDWWWLTTVLLCNHIYNNIKHTGDDVEIKVHPLLSVVFLIWQVSTIYLSVLHILPFFCLYGVSIVHFSIECILRNISYENVEIQNIRFTILLVHGKITFMQCSRRMSLCFGRFQVIVELSCDSIFVELFATVSVHYKFTIPLFRYWKQFSTERTNMLDL